MTLDFCWNAPASHAALEGRDTPSLSVVNIGVRFMPALMAALPDVKWKSLGLATLAGLLEVRETLPAL